METAIFINFVKLVKCEKYPTQQLLADSNVSTFRTKTVDYCFENSEFSLHRIISREINRNMSWKPKKA